jgi:hypothetical protein
MENTGTVLAKASRMNMETESRFDAENVVRLVILTEQRRVEMQLSDSQGATHVVSLPVGTAADLARLICDASEHAPYLVGGIGRRPPEETK